MKFTEFKYHKYENDYLANVVIEWSKATYSQTMHCISTNTCTRAQATDETTLSESRNCSSDDNEPSLVSQLTQQQVTELDSMHGPSNMLI